ncbi:MAG: nucleotidyltransferase domain-containing protein [Deltaproteobacteria bacterium]|nr:nucleotidyltransferase domain-containing protein [Deltaproteobacteria bacterium]
MNEAVSSKSLEVFLEKLKKSHLPILSVILFGSYARGHYTIDSDIDVLIITGEKNSQINHQIIALAYQAESETDEGEWILPLVVDEKQYEKWKMFRLSIYQNIQSEGKVLWKTR